MREHLRRRRQELGLRQADVSRLLGIDRSSYAHWELGHGRITLQSARKLAAILQTTIDALFPEDLSDPQDLQAHNEPSSQTAP